jgi:hypothetical protein
MRQTRVYLTSRTYFIKRDVTALKIQKLPHKLTYKLILSNLIKLTLITYTSTYIISTALTYFIDHSNTPQYDHLVLWLLI